MRQSGRLAGTTAWASAPHGDTVLTSDHGLPGEPVRVGEGTDVAADDDPM